MRFQNFIVIIIIIDDHIVWFYSAFLTFSELESTFKAIFYLFIYLLHILCSAGESYLGLDRHESE